MERYDYIFAGAGCAALSLVYHLMRSSLRHKKILLLDPNIHQIPDKTWCYWAKAPLEIHPKNSIHSWNSLNLKFGSNSQFNSLENLNYYHLNSKDFYQSLHQEFKSLENIVWKESSVVASQEVNSGVIITTADGEKHEAQVVFDSRFDPNQIISNSHLKQIFSGWRVESSKPIFDPSSFTMMEIQETRSPQFEFFYILPYSKNSALVEFTAYSKTHIEKLDLEKELKSYLSSILKTEDYQISFQENGVIPMTNKSIKRIKSNRVIPIGTAAGWTKASTGYTFQRIQGNAKKIVSNLEKGQSPLNGIERSRRFEFYDNILLNIASKWPERLAGVFEDLFKNNPTDKVLRFLSEETSLVDEIKLLSKLKFSIFIKSLLRYESH